MTNSIPNGNAGGEVRGNTLIGPERESSVEAAVAHAMHYLPDARIDHVDLINAFHAGARWRAERSRPVHVACQSGAVIVEDGE